MGITVNTGCEKEQDIKSKGNINSEATTMHFQSNTSKGLAASTTTTKPLIPNKLE
jgi:hypothetical protein